MLKLTTAKYYIPSGRCIQAIDYSHSQGGYRSLGTRLAHLGIHDPRRTQGLRRGGIMPDIRTEPEYISRFAMTLYALGFIEDFGGRIRAPAPGTTDRHPHVLDHGR